MSRLGDFTQFEDRQFDDVEAMLESGGKTADLYRVSLTGNPGFDTEVGNETRIDRILVYLAKEVGAPSRVKAEGGLKVSKTRYIGLATYQDLRIGDILVISEKRYRVYDLDKSNRGKVEMRLEKIE